MIYPWQHTLQEQLQAVRQRGRLPHALLFSAEAGCGHETFVSAWAQSLLCFQPDAAGLACGDCRSCQVFRAAAHPDFHSVSVPDEKQVITVDQMRVLNQFLELSRSYSPVKVAVIHAAEAMNVNAANSLLKTLEEPAAHTHILLFSLQSGRLLPTVRSRCQQMRMPLPPTAAALAWLETEPAIRAQEQPAATLLTLAAGRPLAALTQADGLLRDKHQRWAQQLTELLTEQTPVAALSIEWSKQSRDELLNWQINLLQSMLKVKYANNPAAEQALALCTEPLQALPQRLVGKQLWGLHDALLQLKALSTHPLNALLFAENMLALWARLK